MRIAELVSGESIATAGTKSVDLNLNDIISRVTVQLRLVNNGSTPTAHPATAVSKIEVSDGSDLLFSLSGKETSALNYYDKGYLPFTLCASENNIYSTVEFHIDFGRYLWDASYALDPKRFNNLQIKITHDKATGASSPDAGYLSVIAHVFNGSYVSPVGFLMSKQVYSYALAASGQERIVLPADYDYRKILFGSLSAGNSPTSQIATVKLSVDNDKSVLVNSMSASDLVKMLAGPKAMETLIGMGSGSAITYFCAPTYETYMNVSPLGTTLAATVALVQSNGGTVSLLSDASKGFQMNVFGYAPHGLIALPQGDQKEPNTWLKASQSGSVALTLTAGSSVGSASTAEVILQQARKY
jgi:hypothetical protein